MLGIFVIHIQRSFCGYDFYFREVTLSDSTSLAGFFFFFNKKKLSGAFGQENGSLFCRVNVNTAF